VAWGAIYRRTLNFNGRVKAGLAALLGVTLVTAGGAAGPLWSPPAQGAAAPRAPAPEVAFVGDACAFANLIRARHRAEDDLYANYCFVLARGLRQFSQFARFDPALPRLDHDGYAGLVRRVVALPVWQPASSEDGRIVIPGYANLREFSRAEEAAVKEGLGSRFWTLVHWTNWRVTFWVTPGPQEHGAPEIVSELRAGRLGEPLVHHWPQPRPHHTRHPVQSRGKAPTLR